MKWRRLAMEMLARREHSARQLQKKLVARGAQPKEAQAVVTTLQTEGLQSDKRFAQSVLQTRVNRGFGPVYIAAVLEQAGICKTLMATILAIPTEIWLEHCLKLYHRKCAPLSALQIAKMRIKHYHFLQQRGFEEDTIRQVLG